MLTEVGQVVYDYAQRILGLRDQVGRAIAEMQSLKRGRIRVGANESASLSFAGADFEVPRTASGCEGRNLVRSGSRVKVIEAFARQHTPLNVTLELATIETLSALCRSELDWRPCRACVCAKDWSAEFW